MGAFANLPFALAPGMGLNAYFTYDVVGFRGTGGIPVPKPASMPLGPCLHISSALLLLLVRILIAMLLCNAVEDRHGRCVYRGHHFLDPRCDWIPSQVRTDDSAEVLRAATYRPHCSALGSNALVCPYATYFFHSIKLATTGGIGFFLAHLGLQTAEGIGLVVTDVATGVTLGGCPAGNRTYAFYDGLSADAYTCDNAPSTKMTAATTWLGIVTLLIMAIFMKRGFNGAIIIGVIFATIISWIPGTQVWMLLIRTRFLAPSDPSRSSSHCSLTI